MLVPILLLRGLKLADKGIHFQALDIFSNYHGLDFEGALLVAHVDNRDVGEIFSYDADFDRIPWIKRLEPQKGGVVNQPLSEK